MGRTSRGRGDAAGLAARLRSRRGEIEQATLDRVRSVSELPAAGDPEYAEGLRRAVAAAIGFGLELIEGGEAREPPIPIELLGQARLAARNRIPLDTVLRRYFAGYSLLGFFTIEEASREGLMDGAELQRLTARQAGHFDRLLAQVAAEHGREPAEDRAGTSERRHLEAVRRLLGGEPVEPSRLGYDLDAHHLGLLARGPDPATPLRELARSLDRALLVVCPDRDTAWAWLGGREALEPEQVLGAYAAQRGDTAPEDPALALGEPAVGLAGWRLTHRQAAAALAVAERGPDTAVRYADVALLASVLQDELLATSLRQLYLRPLEGERDGGAALCETLRAYFAAERNVSSAAAALGLTRKSIAGRLRTAERRLGRPVNLCAAELDLALRMERVQALPESKAGRSAGSDYPH